MSKELLSPFKLHVTVKRAHEVVVADVISSDPFIEVYVGDRVIGKTKVMKSCLSPIWNQSFDISLLHLDSVLVLKLYDHNDYNDDEFLGEVSLAVDTLRQHDVEFTLPVEKAGSTFKAQGSVTFSACVEVHETLVTVQKLPKELERERVREIAAKATPIRGNLARTTKVHREGTEDEINQLLTDTMSSDPVGYALKETVLVKDDDVYDRFLVEDLLRDIRAIDRHSAWALKAASETQPGALCIQSKTLLEIELEATPMQFLYNNMLAGKGGKGLQHPLSATKFDMLLLNKGNRTTDMLIPGYNVHYTAPMLYHGLQLEFYRKGRQNELVVMYTSTVHMTWVFLRQLRAFMALWKNHQTVRPKDAGDDFLHDFVCPISIEIEGMNMGKVGGQEQEVAVSGLAVLSMGRRYELIIQDKLTRDPKFTMSLDDLVSISVNADAPLCENVAAVVEVVHANPTGDEVEMLAEGSGGWTPGKFLMRGGDRLLKSGVSGLMNIKKGGQGLAGAVKDLAQGNTGKVISNTQAKTEAAFSNVGNFIPGLTADKMFYVVVKDRNGSLVTTAKEVPMFNESFAIPLHNLVNKDSMTHGMNVFLMQNRGSSDKVLGEVFIPYKHMIGSGHDKDLHEHVTDGESFVSDYPLNDDPEYTVCIEQATELATASPTFDRDTDSAASASSSGNREFYIKCRFAKWNGSKVGKAFKEVRSRSVKSNCNAPDWGGELLTLSGGDGLHLAEYVRLEVFVGSSMNGVRLGSVFLPVSEFLMNSTTAKFTTFPLKYFKKLPLCLVRAGLGSLRVKIFKRSNNSDSMASVRLRTTLRHCNEYCSFWSSDTILAGTILQDTEAAHAAGGKVDSTDTVDSFSNSGLFVERYAAAPGYEGLILVNTLGGNDGSKNSNGDSNGLLTGITSSLLEGAKSLGGEVVQLFDQSTADPDSGYPITMLFKPLPTENAPPGSVRVEVFEYDNRSILPPYKWITLDPTGFEYKNDAYRRYKDELYKQKAPFTVLEEAKPPTGYEWSGTWKYDATYTKTDESGWSYGLTIGYIRSNLKNNTPNTCMDGVCVRRKKWVRIAVPVAGSEGDAARAGAGRERSQSVAPVPIPTRRELQPLLPAGTVLGLCEERGNTLPTLNSVLVPWSQLKAVTVVTPSVLSIVCQVNKFIRDRTVTASGKNPLPAAPGGVAGWAVGGLSGAEEFKPVDVEIFVWGCPAERLRSLIQERVELVSIRESIIDITAAGSMQMTKALENTPLIAEHERESSKNKIAKAVAVVRSGLAQFAEDEDEEGDGVPDTVELSYGATVVMELDEVLDQLESRARELDDICEGLKAAAPASAPTRGAKVTARALLNKARTGDTTTMAEVARTVTPPTHTAETFSVGRLLFKFITCKKLKNVETLGGQNDVYVSLQLGSWTAKTHAIDDAGSTAMFEYLNFSVENITSKQLIRNHMTVQVYDENKVAADVLIGQATFSVADVLTSVGDWVEIKAHLVDRRGGQAGTIKVCVKIQDALCSGLEGEADEISVANTLLNSMQLERVVILRRIARVQLYIASLLGVGLEGDHDFTGDEITKLIMSDLRKASYIVQQNDVDTASNRIQFLMDMAELRIRDAALRGWTQREGGVFEHTMTTLINSYLIEMVSLLGKFFDDKGVGIASVKGVNSKIKLIRFFMQNDGRLNFLMNRVLRPYKLTLSLPPRFSLCLNFDTLLEWYASTLQLEMKVYVDNAMQVWTDPNKNPNSELFKYKLPWAPQKPSGTTSDNRYNTAIPEDVKNVLDYYLTVAQIKAKDLNMFHATEELRIAYASKIKRVNALVRFAFTSSFSYVCSSYVAALRSKDWTCGVANHLASWKGDNLPEEIMNELYEHMTFLSSVANDAERVCCTGILEVATDAPRSAGSAHQDDELAKTEKMATDARANTFAQFAAVRASALDNLACLAFAFTASTFMKDENDHLVEFEDKWIKACESRAEAKASVSDDDELSTGVSPLSMAAHDLAVDLPGYENLLSFDCYAEFLTICAGKFVVCVLFLLHRVNSRYSLRMGTGNIYLTQLIGDIDAIYECLQSAAKALPREIPSTSQHYKKYGSSGTGPFVAEVIVSRLQRLTTIKFILQASPHSEDFFMFIQDIVREARNYRENSAAVPVHGIDTVGQDNVNQDVFLAYFLRTAMQLRSNPAQKRLTGKLVSDRRSPNKDGKASGDKKRGSVAGAFFASVFHRDEKEPTPASVAATVSPSTMEKYAFDGHFSDSDDSPDEEDEEVFEDMDEEDEEDEQRACVSFGEIIEGILQSHTDEFGDDLSTPIADTLSLFHYSAVRRVYDCNSAIKSQSRGQSKHSDDSVYMQSLPLSAQLLQSSLPFEQLLDPANGLNKKGKRIFDGSVARSVARGTVNAASMTVSGTVSVAKGTANVAKGTANILSDGAKGTANILSGGAGAVFGTVGGWFTRQKSATEVAMEAINADGGEADEFDRSAAEEAHRNMVALADSMEEEEEESPQTQAASVGLGQRFANLGVGVFGKTDNAASRAPAPPAPCEIDVMKEVEVSDVSIKGLFEQMDTFLSLAVENKHPGSTELRTSDLNKTVRKSSTASGSANPKFKGEAFYFTIPTNSLDLAHASNCGNPTHLTVKLTMVRAIFDAHIGTVTIPLDKVFSGRNLVVDDYEIQWTDHVKAKAEKARREGRVAKLFMTLKVS